MKFIPRMLLRPTTIRRGLSTTRPLRNSQFTRGPAPPRLPEEEQKIFEKLQNSSTGAFSTPRPNDVNQSSRPQLNQSLQAADETEQAAVNMATVSADGSGEELHPDVRRGSKPEFEGDTNPKTGEVGGPKNEPLRWGGEGDWSYNGRVTDF